MPSRIVQPRAILARHSLLDGLVAYWPLNEPDGMRVDVVGRNHLADNNTVTQADGKFGKAAQFTRANGEYLSVPDNPTVSMAGVSRMSITCWVWFDTKPGSGFHGDFGLVCKEDYAGNTEYYVVGYDDTGNTIIAFGVFDSNSSVFVEASVNIGSSTTGAWYLLHAYLDGSSAIINVNNGAFSGSAAFALPLRDSTNALGVGGYSTGVATHNGRLAEVGIWKGRNLSPREIDWIWNGGAGRPYPWRA
jgi:hypothetical protein